MHGATRDSRGLSVRVLAAAGVCAMAALIVLTAVPVRAWAATFNSGTGTYTFETYSELAKMAGSTSDGFFKGAYPKVDGKAVSKDSVKVIKVAKGITAVPKYTFNHQKITKVVLASTVKKVGSYAFEGCAKLTKVSLGGTQTVGECAFSGCKKLASVSLPKVQTVGSYAFDSCAGLKTVKLKAVKVIKGGAFSGCSKLKTIEIKSKHLKKVGSEALATRKTATVKAKVLKSKYKAYAKLLTKKSVRTSQGCLKNVTTPVKVVKL